MKKFAIIDKLQDGDWFEDIFDTEEETIAEADREWEAFEPIERAIRSTYVVAEVDVDEFDNIEHECKTVKIYK